MPLCHSKFQRGANCSSFWFMPCQCLWSQEEQACASANPCVKGQSSSPLFHRAAVMMISQDKLSYCIRSHPENGRKRNSTAASGQKSCSDNQGCTQWFPSRNTHGFAAAADSQSTWLLSHAKASKPCPSQSSDLALFIPLIKNWFQLSAAPGYWLLYQQALGNTNSKGPKWGASFLFFQVTNR